MRWKPIITVGSKNLNVFPTDVFLFNKYLSLNNRKPKYKKIKSSFSKNSDNTQLFR